MAITILLEPQDFQPVYNEVVTVLDSTNNSKPNFQYVIDVNVDAVNTSRIKVSPNPDGYGVVDLHKHIEPFISSDLDLTNTKTFQLTPNTFKKYDITLFEEYRVELQYTVVTDDGGFAEYSFLTPHYLQIGDKISITNSTDTSYNGVQTVTAVGTSTTVTTSKAWSATATGDMVKADYSNTLIPDAAVFASSKFANSSVLGWLDVSGFADSTYELNGAIKQLLTSKDNYTIKEDSLVFLNLYNYLTNFVDRVRVTTLDSSGATNGVFDIDNSYFTSSDANKFLTMNVGVDGLNNTTDVVTTVSGALPIIDADVDSYILQVYDNTPNATSQQYTFTINRDCSEYDNYQIVYQDKLGSFVPFNFELASKQTISNKKTDYRKNYGSYDSVANTYGWEAKDRGVKRLDTEINESIDIQSNWITESQAANIVELMNSPEVYHYTNDSQLISINIKTDSLVQKKRITDGLINYKLTFEYSFKNTVQRG